MQSEITRITSIELRDFKNVGYGKITLPSAVGKDFSELSSDVLGIYGQNGSGKTAVVEALFFVKLLLSGQPLPGNIVEYISKNAAHSECIVTFYIRDEVNELLVEYTFRLAKTADNSAKVEYEKLTYKKNSPKGWSNKSTLIEYSSEVVDQVFSPNYRWTKAVSVQKSNKVDFAVAKKLSIRENKSFIFSDDVRKLLETSITDFNELTLAISALHFFAFANLFVIRNGHTGIISLDILLPFSFKHEMENGQISMGDLPISLSEPTILSLEKYKVFSEIILEIDKVIRVLVPGMRLEIKEYGEQTLPDGADGMKFEVLSVRGESKIPIKYESEGIKKILSVLHLLITMFNNTSACVVIDELDAGIFEYLLGEILGILQDSGKGQLIFTSHNLRPLEMINKNNLVFTTTNPQNRYIKLVNVKTNNNLRDLYIRSINLGGQKENIYESTNAFEINRAFKKAGEKFNGKK
ncbi:MAG: AAA family ATPase [Chloroflexi bacterium]|nr:AAA family ATPase [Chloroflexota bacterium]